MARPNPPNDLTACEVKPAAGGSRRCYLVPPSNRMDKPPHEPENGPPVDPIQTGGQPHAIPASSRYRGWISSLHRSARYQPLELTAATAIGYITYEYAYRLALRFYRRRYRC